MDINLNFCNVNLNACLQLVANSDLLFRDALSLCLKI